MERRRSGLRAFLKKNFDFITGILGEVGLTAVIMIVAFIICVVLVLIKSMV